MEDYTKNKIGMIAAYIVHILYPLILIFIWYKFYGGRIKNILFGILGFLVYMLFYFLFRILYRLLFRDSYYSINYIDI